MRVIQDQMRTLESWPVFQSDLNAVGQWNDSDVWQRQCIGIVAAGR